MLIENVATTWSPYNVIIILLIKFKVGFEKYVFKFGSYSLTMDKIYICDYTIIFWKRTQKFAVVCFVLRFISFIGYLFSERFLSQS